MRFTARRLAALGVIALMMAGCGGGSHSKTTTATTQAQGTTATSSTSTTTTSKGPTAPLPADQEAQNAVACLKGKGLSPRTKTFDGHPEVIAPLPSGNGNIVMVMFGPSRGAGALAKKVHVSLPSYDVLTSPNDSVLIIFKFKPSSQEFKIADDCQKAAYNG